MDTSTIMDACWVVCGVLIHNGRVLVTRRLATAEYFPNLWEFPGGKVELGESPIDALVREFREELGIDVRVGGFVADVVSATPFEGREVRLQFSFVHQLYVEDPHCIGVSELRWMTGAQLREANLEFIPSNEVVLRKVIGYV